MKIFPTLGVLGAFLGFCAFFGVASGADAEPKLPDRGLCAHRGYSITAAENTIPALRSSGVSGAAMVEFDIRISRDGGLIIVHDTTVDRTTDGTGKIADLTAAQIKRLDAGTKFVEQTKIAKSELNESYRGASVPTFDEALAVLPRNIWINVHYNGDTEHVDDVVRVIVAQKRLKQAFLAASEEHIAEARRLEPLILTCNMTRQSWTDATDYVAKTIEIKADFIQLIKGTYTAEQIARLKAAGVRINCFGTNDADELRAMFEEGIDFPLVDDVKLLDVAKEFDAVAPGENSEQNAQEIAPQTETPDENAPPKDRVETQAERAWNAAWSKFYSPQTQLFYDFIESYEPGKTLDHLPTADEISRLDPNPCGYGTAMEDCAISGGILLTALVDRFASTGDEAIRAQAADVFSGLERLTTVSGSPGFVARGVSPKALNACYINSSRDQVSHLVFGVWNYWRSPLPDDATKERAAAVLFAVADRMTRNVTPENDFDFLCSDGSRCRIGICRMADVDDHEAARLPAIYAAAWDVAKRSGNAEKTAEYWELWRRWEKDAVAQSANLAVNDDLKRRVVTWGLLQMQESLDVLWRLEPDAELSATLQTTSRLVSNLAKQRQNGALNVLKSRDLTQVAPSWREAGGLNGEYRKTWRAPRECGEIALTVVNDGANPDSLDAETTRILTDALLTPNFDKISTCGVFHLLGAFEKARRRGVWTDDEK